MAYTSVYIIAQCEEGKGRIALFSFLIVSPDSTTRANSDDILLSSLRIGVLVHGTMTSARSTLIIKSGAEFSCLLSADSPTPIHIFALLTQPLSGTCHTLNTLAAAKSRHASGIKEPSVGASTDNTRRRVFAADVTAIVTDLAASTDGVAGSLAAAAAIPPQACLKYATGVNEVTALRREAMFYSHELAALADIAVPRTYGFYTGGTEALPVACLVMDLCISTEMLRSADEFWYVCLPHHIWRLCNSHRFFSCFVSILWTCACVSY